MMRHRRTAVFLMMIAALLGGLITGRDLLFTITYLLALLLIISFQLGAFVAHYPAAAHPGRPADG